MGNETATDSSMQDIAARLEPALEAEHEQTDLTPETEDAVVEDEAILPETDDADTEEDDQLDDDVVDELETEEEATLASYLGVDDDRLEVGDDGSVSLKAKIDGEEKLVPLSELVSSYQLQGHVNNKSIAFEAERKEFEGIKQQVAQELHTRIQGVQAMGDELEKQLVSEYEMIDWTRLRAEDPAQWSALRQEFAEKAQKLQSTMAAAGQASNQANNEAQQQAITQRNQALAQEMEKAVIANPTWVDPAVKTAAVQALDTFMRTTYGFGDEDMALIGDHRVINLMQDAMAFRGGKKAAEKKAVKKLPKFQKPGGSKKQVAAAAGARQTKAMKAKLKASGSVGDTAALLLKRMK